MNFPSVSSFSVSKGTGGTNPPEMYVPLWWCSGNESQGAASTSATDYVTRSSTGYNTTASFSSANKLHTLNVNWNPNLQYSFEAALASGSASYTAYASLYDATSSQVVNGSQISYSGTSLTVVRSGKVTLTPGHTYAITYWTTGSSAYLTDASLIVFPQ